MFVVEEHYCRACQVKVGRMFVIYRADRAKWECLVNEKKVCTVDQVTEEDQVLVIVVYTADQVRVVVDLVTATEKLKEHSDQAMGKWTCWSFHASY